MLYNISDLIVSHRAPLLNTTNLNSTAARQDAELVSSRTTVNQTTFAILISILVVADMFLVWSLGYIVIYYEKRGRIALEHYFAFKFNKQRPNNVS